MRVLHVALVISLAACTDTTLESDTSYRRLLDQFASHDTCIAEGDFLPCYQTLTLCSNGLARIDLENSPQAGTYQLAGTMAVATFLTRTIDFDLEAASSEQLPGVHPWEHVDPIFQGCED